MSTVSRPRHLARAGRTARALSSIVLSAAMVGGGLVAPAAVGAAPVGAGFNLNAADLRFILAQIKISENHAAAPDYACEAILGPGPNQVPSPVLPYGLRTVDGSCNNLQPGQGDFGRADELFPRLLAPAYRLAEAGSSYTQKSGTVIDSQPRTVSNLVVDQTPTNPAAVAAAGEGAVPDPESGTLFIPNVAPDVGLSAPFNSVFTFFGQFFDHGLDLVSKGGSGAIFMPLQPDDPLFVVGSPTNFMVLTRATNQPGPDGTVGDDPSTPEVDESADDIQEGTNTTTPFVDQNQTYTSHPSHQVFLRAYELDVLGRPVPTGKLIDGAVAGNIANWAEVKAQARAMLGIRLVDRDVFNVPLLATDPYGHFIPDPATGYAQIVTASGLVVGDPAANGGLGVLVPQNAFRTGHAFLDDIAHNAAPSGSLTPDPDSDISTAGSPQPAGTYDDELLDRHFVTGDGRGNENIGLTAIHTVFHSEHNRLADEIGNPGGLIDTLLTPTEAAEWHAANPASGWGYGERVFQAARFVTEMEYQHLVFEEFARKVQPQVNVFAGYHTEINPAIAAEFAHTVYRFGHSMLTETVARTAADEVTTNDVSLFEAFLNPVEFNAGGLTAAQAVGQIVRGSARQVGNEIDEFVTDVLRNRLVGLPLDLPTINMARGRSEGIPSLNSARRQFFDATGHPELAPYESWADYSLNLKHEETLLNLVAAYGTHPIVTGLDPDGAGPIVAASLEARRIAADQLLSGTTLAGPDGILGPDPSTALDDIPANGGAEHPFIGDDPLTELVNESLDDTPAQPGPDGILGPNPATALDDIAAPADSLDFMLSTGDWANVGGVTITGVDNVDYWVGGLTEKQAPFGGLLGSTFNYVFETQLENLQDGDRFYYLTRTVGLNLLVQLEGNSFAELIMRNSDVEGLPADVFSRPDFIFRVPNLGASGPILNDPTTEWNETSLLTRNIPTARTIRFAGAEHVVFNGTDVPNVPDNGVLIHDRIYSSEGDDTIRGNAGNDWAEGGSGNDQFVGGLGNDILNDLFGDDVLKGGDGNDALSSGQGFDLNQGGRGDDFVVSGSDPTETFGGPGNDFVFAGDSADTVFGDDGDDWIEGGAQADLLQGDNGFPFQNDPNGGHDVIVGDGGNDDYDSEGGDDIMVAGPGIERNEGMLGFDWLTHRGDPQAANADLSLLGLLPPDVEDIRDRFDLTEGLSGWKLDDILRGDSLNNAVDGVIGHELTADGIARISGLDALLPGGATSFDTGNIIIGGAGSDLLEGRGGDDILDGDRWLNVQLSDGSQTFDSMHALRARVFAGTLDPGTLSIVRSIVATGALATDVDTALFSGPLANYSIDFNVDGSVTVTDVSAVPVDGTDTLWNVEQAVFCDVPGVDPGTCDLFSAPVLLVANIPATGAPTLSPTTPTEGPGTPVTASTAGIADANGLGGVTFTFQWQAGAVGGGAPFTNIAGATLGTFTPVQAQVNRQLQVVVSFVDDAGNPETVTSAPTTVVGDRFSGLGVADTFTGTAGNDIVAGNGGADTLTTLDGADAVTGGAGNDTISSGPGDDTVAGNAGNDTIATAAGNDTVDVLGTGDGFDNVTGGAGSDRIRALGINTNIGLTQVSGVETVTANGFTNVNVVGSGGNDILDFAGSTLIDIVSISGAGGNDTITGTALADVISGGAGVDTITGNGGQDVLSGDAGNDAITAGADNDIITFNGAGGSDSVAGGGGVDEIRALSNGTIIGLSQVSGIETVNANGFLNVSIVGTAGNETFDFSAATLTGIVSINGGGGLDTISGSTAADVINGDGGNDTITGGGANDTMNGGAGTDTFRFAAGFGSDTIVAFDANATGGQDLLDISALGITAATFGANVTIAASGATDTLVTVAGGGTILVVGVPFPGTPANQITIADFVLAP